MIRHLPACDLRNTPDSRGGLGVALRAQMNVVAGRLRCRCFLAAAVERTSQVGRRCVWFFAEREATFNVYMSFLPADISSELARWQLFMSAASFSCPF